MKYLLNKLKSKITGSLCQTLRIDYIRLFIGSLRLRFFTLTCGVKSLESKDAFELTIFHNMKAIKNYRLDFLMTRMNKLILPLLGIETVFPDSSILVIGPRTENNLLRLYCVNESKISPQFYDYYQANLIHYEPFLGQNPSI